MKRLKDDVLKIDKDWFMYFIGQEDYELGEKIDKYNPIEEWDTLNEWIISELEHELDIYYEWKEEGFKTPFSWVNKNNIKKVKRVLDNYYNDKYIKE